MDQISAFSSYLKSFVWALPALNFLRIKGSIFNGLPIAVVNIFESSLEEANPKSIIFILARIKLTAL